MALTDKITVASINLHQDIKGMTGFRSYLVPEADIFNVALPTPGSIWPGPGTLPYLVCVEADWDEQECGRYLAQYRYSTERQLGDEFAEIGASFSSETTDQTKGYTWKDGNCPVVEDIPTTLTLMEYTMGVKTLTAPYEAIASALNCVNDRIFRGFAAGHLRLDGPSVDEAYDINGGMVSARTVFRFMWRDRNWQECWREPIIARDGNGNERYYQGSDAAGADYDVAKDGQPVIAKAGAWDTPETGSPATNRYGTCDFATVLGLPKLPGDG